MIDLSSAGRVSIGDRDAASGSRVLEGEQWLPVPLERVFPFFADALNLETITPGWLRFRVVTPEPIPMRVGQTIDYRLRVHGVPIRWQSQITAWEPPYRFVDEQRKGPYKLWRHEHLFMERAGGTEIIDRVEYAVRGGPLAAWIDALLVRGDVQRIFEHRAEAIREIFLGEPGSPIGGALPDRA